MKEPCFVAMFGRGEAGGGGYHIEIYPAIHLAKPVVGKTLIGTEDWSWIVHGWIMESR